MYPITDALKKRFESGERKKAWITLSNASVDGLVITEEDIKADSFSIDRYCATGNKIEIGSAVSSEFSVVLNNSDGKFDGIVFEGSVLCVDVGFAHTTGNYVRCGFFTVDEPPRTFSTISLKALDYMMLYDKTIDRAKLNKAFYTPEELVRSISELCEVEVSDSIEFEKLPSADQSLSIPATATTYRQLLQWVAGITGTCAYIDWDGKLRMSWFVEADPNINITPAFRYSGNVHESDIKITGVTVKTQEATFTDGTETYPLVVEGNGFVYNGTEEHRATSIGSVVKNFTYRPYECTCLPMPYLFPLDRITYTDKSGQEISTVVTNHTFGLNSTSSLAAQGESQQKKSYSGQRGLTKAEVDSAIAEAMKNFDSSTEHFHVMYSAYDGGRDTNGDISWSEIPNADTVYLGTCATNSKDKPQKPESYDWVKIKGESPYTLVSDTSSIVVPLSASGTVEKDTRTSVLIQVYEGSKKISTPLAFERMGTEHVLPTEWEVEDDGYGYTSIAIPKDWTEPVNHYPYQLWYYLDDWVTELVVPITFVKGGKDGEKGKPGESLQVKYLNSATAPTITNNNVSSWSDAVPAPEKGKRTYMTQKLSNETNWSTPIQISAEDGTTPTVSINSSGYWVINGDTTTVKAQGKNGDTPTITVGANGNWFVDGKDTGAKAQGEQGKDGADIEYVYYRSQTAVSLSAPKYTNGTLTSGWKTSPQGITETYKYEYVSVRKKAAGSTSWGAFSTPIIWSKWGEKGTDGDGIEYKYYLKNDSTKPTYSASDTKWTDDPAGVSASNMYEYVVQITHHGNGTTTTSAVSLWSKWGETGVSVVEVITEYHKSASDSTAPATNSTGWTTEAPLWEDGYYLWTRLKTVLSKGSPQYSTPVVDASWKKVTAVESATDEFNKSLLKALGFYITDETLAGTTTRYYHSKPNLEDCVAGDIILIFNSSGFGVCTTGWNGENTFFQNGINFGQGKAIWNVLAANKISADLIETGKLKSVDSAAVSSTLNLDTGELLFEASGNKIAIEGPQANEDSSAQGVVDVNLSSLSDMGLKLINDSSGERVLLTMSGILLARKQFLEELIAWVKALLHWSVNENAPHPGEKPSEPYVQIMRELLFSTNIKCDNFSFLPDGSDKHVNMSDFYSNIFLMRDSLSALQTRIGELETALGQQHTHTNASAVRENIVEATCTSNGSYDSVVYCATCGEEISRTKITTAALGHTDSNGDGYCDRCGGSSGGDDTTYYTLSTVVSPPGAGTVTGAGTYEEGKIVRVTATPNSNYQFIGWYENGSLRYTSATATPTMSSDRTLVATFESTGSGGSGEGMTVKITSSGATSSDTIQLYKIYGDTYDMSSPLGTQAQLNSSSGYGVGCYAKPGAGRKIEFIETILGGTSYGKTSAEDMGNAINSSGVLDQYVLSYDSSFNGMTVEMKIYFAQA